MRGTLCFFLFFSSVIAYCQESYVFDQLLEYEVIHPQESVQKRSEQRFYFINSKDNSYLAIAVKRPDGAYTLVFRDNQKDKIAELIVSKQDLFGIQQLSIQKKLFKRNPYSNLVAISDYTIDSSAKDSVTEVYTYTYKHSKWNNRYKIKNHVIIINKSVNYFTPGVGFGDYYSLLDWKEKFPVGLVQESLTEKLDGSIVSHSILSKVSDYDITFDFK